MRWGAVAIDEGNEKSRLNPAECRSLQQDQVYGIPAKYSSQKRRQWGEHEVVWMDQLALAGGTSSVN